jgi:lipopolysaccharide transport system ATP-binding protein
MSAILRLTQETIVIEKGQMVMRAPTPQAVDYYLSRGFSQSGIRTWEESEIPPEAAPFRPLALRVMNNLGKVADTVRSTEPVRLEIEYELLTPLSGLRVGIYLMSTRGEYIFTSFDTDEPEQYERLTTRPTGHYISRCTLPADLLNEGRFVIGVNASSFRIKRYFQDEQALTFNVDASGAPGMQWSEARVGPLRPRLEWKIEAV